jgi:hypothetical protein
LIAAAIPFLLLLTTLLQNDGKQKNPSHARKKNKNLLNAKQLNTREHDVKDFVDRCRFLLIDPEWRIKNGGQRLVPPEGRSTHEKGHSPERQKRGAS